MSGGGAMDTWGLVAANVVSTGVLCGGIALCIRAGEQGRARRRELEHAERMRALELGRPIDNASAERHRALGAVGVVVPIFTMLAVAAVCMEARRFEEPGLRFGALAVVWLVGGVVCLYSTWAVTTGLQRPADPPG